MESIEVVISIILQFSGIFGMYYLVRAIFMFRRKKFPTPGFEEDRKEENKAWCRGEGMVCLYWGILLLLLNAYAWITAYTGGRLSLIVVIVFLLLLCAGYGGRIRNNLKYRNRKSNTW